MSLSSKAHIVYLNEKGFQQAVAQLKYFGTVPDDIARDALGNVEVGSVVVVSNSAEANNSPAIYHYNGTTWQLIGSNDIVNSVINILSDRYSATEIDALLLGLGIYPPVSQVSDLATIPNPQVGYICNVIGNTPQDAVIYQYTGTGWEAILDLDVLTTLSTVVSDLADLTTTVDELKYWKAPKNTLGELNGIPTPEIGEIRIVVDGVGGNPTTYRYYNSQWNVYNSIPSVALESDLSGLSVTTDTNQIVFVEESESFWFYSVGTTSWVEIGGGSSTYTNPDPMPVAVGGYAAGTSFNNRTQDEMWTGLLYPYLGPQITGFVPNIPGQENNLLENGTVVSNIDVNFSIAPKTENIVTIEYRVGGVLIDTDTVNYSTNTTINKSLPVSYSTPNSSLPVQVKVIDNVGGSDTETWTYYFRDKVFFLTEAVDYIADTEGNISTWLNGITTSNYDLQASRNRTEDAFNPSSEYIYYCWKQSYGTTIPPVKFILNGLPNTAWETRLFSYTNSKGYVEDFVLWRSSFVLNNSFNVKVQ